MLDINKEITANIGIVIRRLRREKGITQKQLSIELGISVAYINLIENNRRDITVPLLIKVAKLFNIELSDLTSDYNKQLNSDLMDIFSDTLFEEQDLKKEFPVHIEKLITNTNYRNQIGRNAKKISMHNASINIIREIKQMAPYIFNNS